MAAAWFTRFWQAGLEVEQVTDTLSKAERSKRMSLVRGRNTGPELIVRKIVHSMGYRFSLRQRHLPGKPDLIFPSRNKVIFVHGCFWHRHSRPGCKLARLPKSRLHFWLPKLEGNRIRDKQKQKELRTAGWKFLVVWECEIGHIERLRNTLEKYLGAEDARGRIVRRSRRSRDGH